MTKDMDFSEAPAEKAPGKSPSYLRFLYKTLPGRVILRGAISPIFSKLGGAYADSRLSKVHIKRFAKRNHINLSEYKPTKYRCYNDFFTRQILPEYRPIDMAPESLISPCDGNLSAYRITEDLICSIKGSNYTVSDLLQNDALTSCYQNGICLVFRLCVSDYHRYCYLDSGTKGENVYIKGKMHTVSPIALRRYPVFVQNCREYTVMETEHFGKVTEVEVGAMLVGRIDNYQQAGAFRKGEEKGKFLYGGSTVVVLLEKDSVNLSECFFKSTEKGMEIPVRYGQKIGVASLK